jgi:hypothetical protein
VTIPPRSGSLTPRVPHADSQIGLILMLIGGVFAILLSSVSLFGAVACVGVIGTKCAVIFTLLLLPFATGVVAIALSAFGFVRPHLRRLLGAVVLALSGGVVGLGLVIFGPYPEALVFVIVLYAWPLFLILVGSILLVTLGKPLDLRSQTLPVPR